MLKSSIRTIGASLIAALVAFASSVVFARILGPAGRGELAAAMLIITSASLFSQFGLGQAIVFQARHDEADRRALLWSSVAFVAGVAALLAACGRWLFPVASPIPDAVLEIGAAAYAVMAFCHYASQIQKSLILYNAIRVFQPLAVVCCVLLLAYAGSVAVTSIVWLHIATAMTAALAALSFLPRWLAGPDGRAAANFVVDARAYVARGMSYYGLALIGFVSQNVDRIYLMSASNLQSLGIYVTAYATSRAVGYFYEAIATSLYSQFAGAKREEIHRAVATSIALTFIPMLVGCLILSAASGILMSAFFGREFSAAGPVFSILVVDSVIGSASWVLAQQFNAIGRPGMVLVRQTVAALPVLCGLYFVREDHAAIDLASLVLAGSVLRLCISLLMFRMIGLPVPRLWPTGRDIATAKSALANLLKRA